MTFPKDGETWKNKRGETGRVEARRLPDREEIRKLMHPADRASDVVRFPLVWIADDKSRAYTVTATGSYDLVKGSHVDHETENDLSERVDR